MVLWSEEAKKIILIELTVPWEEGCEQAFERESAKYQDLLHDCRGKGWQAWLFPVEDSLLSQCGECSQPLE